MGKEVREREREEEEESSTYCTPTAKKETDLACQVSLCEAVLSRLY